MLQIDRILKRARRLYGERNAIADQDGWMTYETLGKRVDALSRGLRQLGLQRGDRVAFLDHNSRQFLECYYATAQAGFVFVPLNSRLSGAEIAFILNDCSARVLIYADSFSDLVESVRPSLNSIERIVRCGGVSRLGLAGSFDYEAIIESAEAENEQTINATDDPAQIYYTSGTTGEPKGVVLSYGNMQCSAVDAVLSLGLSWRDTWMHAAPLFHLVDAWAVWAMPLMGGAQSVLHFEPERMLGFVQNTRSTATALPPTLLNMVAGHPKAREFDLSSLRLIMYGGSPTTDSVIEHALDIFPSHFAHAYGITETSGIVTLLRTTEREEISGKVGCAGQAAPSITIEIVNDAGEVLPQGEVGEIVVRGPRVMKGYWRKPDATSQVLINGGYHTGDLGYLDEGDFVTIVDRKKDMIISGGENVYSAEVENVLAAAPFISEVAVIGIPDPTWGEAVHAVVYSRDGALVKESDLIAWCRGRIANYKIPKTISVSVDPLPKTGPGKIAKRKLRDEFWKDQGRKI